eukprot:TRINITY_DN10872_c0_g1_i2.p1 TRINITY_DN10872_c0_g1~~TRINITY_DN10872_c0_g1_i2.p1  ORF type:complete len:227 (-),score=33.06 TRINITY_DN10872_c0_g1_i2:36-716(-)
MGNCSQVGCCSQEDELTTMKRLEHLHMEYALPETVTLLPQKRHLSIDWQQKFVDAISHRRLRVEVLPPPGFLSFGGLCGYRATFTGWLSVPAGPDFQMRFTDDEDVACLVVNPNDVLDICHGRQVEEVEGFDRPEDDWNAAAEKSGWCTLQLTSSAAERAWRGWLEGLTSTALLLPIVLRVALDVDPDGRLTANLVRFIQGALLAITPSPSRLASFGGDFLLHVSR